MAFVLSDFARQTVGLNSGEVTADAVIYGAPAWYTYRSAADDIATIVAANYFADAVYKLSDNDLIFIVATDAVGLYTVSAIDRAAGTISLTAASLTGAVDTANIVNLAVTTAKLAADAVTNAKLADDAVETANILDANVTTAKLAADAVDNTKLADNAVSLENLDAGITPSHIVVFAGQPTTTGGAAAEAITVTGAAATDLAFVEMVDDGTNNTTIVNAVVTLNTLTVTFSADPGADAVINYQLLRAAS